MLIKFSEMETLNKRLCKLLPPFKCTFSCIKRNGDVFKWTHTEREGHRKYEKQIAKCFSFIHIHHLIMYLIQLLLPLCVMGPILVAHHESNVNFFIRRNGILCSLYTGIFLQRKNFAKLKSCREYMFTFQCEKEEMRYEMLIDHIKWGN